VSSSEVVRDLRGGDGAGRAAPEPSSRRLAQLRLGRAGRERPERVRRVLAQLGRQLGVLRRVEQRGVVRGVAFGRQRPALDRVGEDHARAVADLVRLAVAVEQSREVVAAEVAEGRQQLVVVEVVDVDLDALSELGRIGAQEPLVLLVGHRVDAGHQVGAPSQQRPVLDHHRVPAGGLEHRGDPAGGDVGDDPVQRLPVEVDDPHDLTEAADHRIRDRLPAGALVEFGVTDQRDLAAAARDVEVARDVAMRERAPDRRRGAEADAAGRVVDRVGVLRPARVGLQAAVRAQRRQIAAVEAAEQVVDRVQDRARVRFDAHAVRRFQDAEVQRGHQAHHRRAARLVAADLHAGAVLADAVRVVHDAGGQPQHALLDALERLEVGLGGHRHRAGGYSVKQ